MRKDWLSSIIENEIREKHKEIYQAKSLPQPHRFIQYIADRDRWWLVILIVAGIFGLGCILNIEALNIISIKKDTADKVVDQRTANIAAIISITLVVIGFLINNLAVKEAFAYRLLFRHSFLYPTIYFTLATIGAFVVISTLRDTFSEATFIRAVIIGSYLMLVVIVLIALLFRRIIQFIDSSFINDIYRTELLSEAKRNLYLILISNLSKKYYNSTMETLGVRKYDITEALSDFSKISFGEIEIIDTPKETRTKVVVDINIKKIERNLKAAKAKDSVIVYKELGINQTITVDESFFWFKDDSKVNTKLIKKLQSSITLKDLKAPKVDITVRNFLDEKFLENVKEGKLKSVQAILEMYLDLYKLQIENIEKHV